MGSAHPRLPGTASVFFGVGKFIEPYFTKEDASRATVTVAKLSDYYGESEGEVVLVKMKESGHPDVRFGLNGITTVPLRYLDPYPKALYFDKAGNILVAGSMDKSTKLFIAKYDSKSGSLVKSFGKNGIAIHSLPGPCKVVLGLPDGAWIALGGKYQADHFWVSRFTKEGKKDLTFGDGGSLWVPTPQASNGLYPSMREGAIVDASGRIVVLGLINPLSQPPYLTQSVLVRLTTAGEIDKTFHGDGSVFLPPVKYQFPKDIHLVGKAGIQLTLSGTDDNEDSLAWVYRLNEDGEFDMSFGEDGKVNLPFPKGYRMIWMGSSLFKDFMRIVVTNISVGPELFYSLSPKGEVSSFLREMGMGFVPLISELSNGKTLTTGNARPDSPAELIFTKMHPDGTPDVTYGGL